MTNQVIEYHCDKNGGYKPSTWTPKAFRLELRRLRKLYPDIDSWVCWYDGGEGNATWDGKTTVADTLNELRGSDLNALLVVEEHDGWSGPWQGFRYIPEQRCIIIDYNIFHGMNDDTE